MTLESIARIKTKTILELDYLNPIQLAELCCFCMNEDLKYTIDDCWFNARFYISMSIDVSGKPITMTENLVKIYNKETK